MGSFYFFTDTDLLINQTNTEAYGPVVGDEVTKYRVTSMHSASSNPSAYAICNGVVMIQEDPNDSDLVNLILRPLQQPEFNIGYIKYFIYKSILKLSLIDATGELIADAETNDLTQSIWDAQEAINTSIEVRTGTNPEDEPSSKTLGINYKNDGIDENELLDSASIDSLFFRDTANFQFPVVKGGWKIGTFSSESFGLEIIIEKLGFQPSFEIARINEHLIEVTGLGGAPTQADDFSHWNEKEKILSYIDPCAFFGNYYGYKLNIKTSIATEFISYSGKDIYSNCLTTFFNKNKVYLDIRNELNFSIDYMRNYGREIQLAFDDVSTPGALDYYSQSWPLLAFENGDFPTGNTTDKNILRILLPLGNNSSPLVYFTNVILEESFPGFERHNRRFKTMEYITTNDFLETEIVVYFPNNEDGDTELICNYALMNYLQFVTIMPDVELSGTNLKKSHQKDFAIAPLAMKLPWPLDAAKGQSYIFYEPFFLSQVGSTGEVLITNRCIIRDVNGDVLYLNLPVEKYAQNSFVANLKESLISINSSSENLFNSILYSKSKLLVQNRNILIDEEIRNEFVIVSGDPEQLLTSQYSGINPTNFEFELLTGSEYETLISIGSSQFLPEFPVFLKYKSNEMFFAANELYIENELILTGFQLDNINNIIELIEIPTDIFRINKNRNTWLSNHTIGNNTKIFSNA